MKRHGNLWNTLVSKENITYAFWKACKGKRQRSNVIRAIANKEESIEKVRELLITESYKQSPIHNKLVFEPKLRHIYSLPFMPDRIVHHALMNVLEPIWDNLMYTNSYSCRIGKGQHRASKLCLKLTKKYKYVAQLDISQFYVNIDHEILKSVYRHKIKDKKVLKLLDMMVDAIDIRRNNIKLYSWLLEQNKNVIEATVGINKLTTSLKQFEGRPSGLAVGSLPSQWLGNLYLNGLDYYVLEKLKYKGYIRFCDDILIFADTKEELHLATGKIRNWLLVNRKLTFSKERIYPTSQGIDFCGYRHFPNGVILLRKSTAKRKKLEMKSLIHLLAKGFISKETAVGKLASARGWLKYANSHNLQIALKLNQLEEEVKNYGTDRTTTVSE